jgi:predicted transcriptional regulator
MTFKILDKNREAIKEYIKNNKEVSITQIYKDLNISYKTINTVLDELQLEGNIIIARYETIVGDKVITQGVDIKWVK